MTGLSSAYLLNQALSRRRFLRLGAASLGSAVLLGACGGDDEPSGSSGGASTEDLGSDSITIANWGGTTGDGMMRAWAKPFTDRTGVDVKQVALDYGKVRSQVEAGNVSWDWIDAEGWFPHGNPDLVENLDPAAIGVTEDDFLDIIPEKIRPNGITSYLTAYVIAYNSERSKRHPRNWQEFFDPKAIPGKRSIYNWPFGMVELALLGDGVKHEDLYPLDLDRAFNKLDSIRDHLVFWNTGAESQQQLVSGAADFVAPWNNRAAYVALGGMPIAVEWNEQLMINAFHVVIKGSKNAKATTEFIKTALEPKNQAEMALHSGYAPTRNGATELVEERVRPWLPTHEENAGKAVGFVSSEWWGENLEDVSAKWTEWASS